MNNESEPFRINDGHLIIKTDSVFMKHLNTTELKTSKSKGTSLRMVGQMIALANPSEGLMPGGSPVRWVELDPRLSRSVGFSAAGWKEVTPGYSVGFIWVPQLFLAQIQKGEHVEVFRYGLRKASSAASVVSVHEDSSRGREGRNRTPVLFLVPEGRDWYPGTNCEVEFPLIKSHPVEVPSTAILHEGFQEYVYKEVTPGEYVPEAVSIVDETPTSAEVLGDLHEGDLIINSGAILLKPLLRGLLKIKEGGPDVP